ncbi:MULTISPECIES: nuclear transport factor 2 family protein [Mesorhizobium]|uniref:Nuclear transport factor 2 family protein n=1 Tax=Mesorhizobium neociceri TaxID=1307853 RepID=A0A838B8D2_9HYPH|nr:MULTISPECIES: nuclear transport factor 2 family protein [Mesorhizobium]MBA1142347.1 nuclear transport factor 2 family protein [Mesorhizobium neociceri]
MLKKTIFASIFLVTASVAGLAVPVYAQDATQTQIVQDYELAQANKALVTKAFQELFGDHDLTALDRYWATDYIQHNPSISDGREAVKTFFESLGILTWPKQQVKFERVIAEGDLVMLQTVQPALENSPATVIVDIFRVEKGKIVEHWDVIQPVPAEATNQRPMY